jgi:hypothetical protein
MRRRRGPCVRTGALALYPGSVAPGPFWALIQELASETEWLRGTFELSGAVPRRGVLRADGGPPSFTFPCQRQHIAGLTLLLSGEGLCERALERRILRCIESEPLEIDPFVDGLARRDARWGGARAPASSPSQAAGTAADELYLGALQGF